MIYRLFAFFFLLQATLFAEQVLIITTAYNRPDFIELQAKTFRKFLKDDFRFVVFNDAREKTMQRRIENTCSLWDVECINIPQEIHDRPYLLRDGNNDFHNPSVRNCNAVQYALDTLGFAHNGIVAVVDSDLFLVKNFSLKNYLKGYQLAGLHQQKSWGGTLIPYLWIGIVFMDMSLLPQKETINFNCGKISGITVDAGGFTHYYLKSHPELKIQYFDQVHSSSISCRDCVQARNEKTCTHNRLQLQERGFDNHQIAALQAGLHDVEFFIKGTFFHYRAGTNWNQQSKEYHETKSRLLNLYILDIMAS